MVEEALADGIHDALTGPFENDDLAEIGNEADDNHRQEDQSELSQAGEAVVKCQGGIDEVVVHADLDQPRQGEACCRHQE